MIAESDGVNGMQEPEDSNPLEDRDWRATMLGNLTTRAIPKSLAGALPSRMARNIFLLAP